MLLHIRLRLFSPFRKPQLVELTIEPLGLHLRGTDLATRRPYGNNGYAVACRRKNRKAVDGILIETPQRVTSLHYTARWALDAELVVTHKVNYKLLDQEFDAASDSMMLWYGCLASLGGWSSRWPAWAEGLWPAAVEPKMEVLPTKDSTRAVDVLDERGWITERREVFAMPTIERERILAGPVEHPMPPYDSVFNLSEPPARPPRPRQRHGRDSNLDF